MSVFGLDQPCHHTPEDSGIHCQAAAGEEPDAGGNQAAPGGNRGAERHHPVRTGNSRGGAAASVVPNSREWVLSATPGSRWVLGRAELLPAPSRAAVGWALVQTVWIFSKLWAWNAQQWQHQGGCARSE